MATLSPSGLKTVGTGSTTWLDDYFDNIERLNDLLLYLGTDATHHLENVDVTAGEGLADDSVLAYNSSTTKWEPMRIHVTPYTTTTTTTTSTSTSTSTTSTAP